MVAIAGRPKLLEVANLGADHVIARDLDDLQAAAVEVADERPDVVLDVVGGDGFGGWLESRSGKNLPVGRHPFGSGSLIAKEHVGNIVVTI